MNTSTSKETLFLLLNKSKIKDKLIFEICLGFDKFNKSGHFSGLLRAADIFSIDPVQISNGEFENFIKQNIINGNFILIKKNKLLISNYNILASASKLYSYFLVYDKNTVKLKNIKIYNETNNNLFELNGKTLVIYNLPNEPLNAYGFTPILKLATLSRKKITAELSFDYLNVNIRTKLTTDEFHDFYKEKKCAEILKKYGWINERKNIFTINEKALYISLLDLQKNNFIILFKNKQIVPFSNYHISIKNSNHNWFEITGFVNVDNEEYEINDIIQNLKNDNQWIEIKNQMLLFPSSIKKIKSYLKNSNTIKIPVANSIDAFSFYNDMISEYKQFQYNPINYKEVSLNISLELLNILRPYQKIGVKWLKTLYKQQISGCLADEMGLGKTVQVLAFLSDKEIKNELPNLIVVPKTLLYNWVNEIKIFSPKSNIIVYHGNKRTLTNIKPNTLILTTYGTLDNDIEEIAKFEFNCLIIDEIQFIKNYRSKHHRTCKKVNAKCKIGMTGTPIENSSTDLWSIFNVLLPNYFGNLSSFNNNIENINELIKPVVLRRTKNDVLKSLPKKIIKNYYCELYDEQKELYKQIVYSMNKELKRKNTRYEIKNDSTLVLKALLRLRQLCCHPDLLPFELNRNAFHKSSKFDAYKKLINTINLTEQKIVVFCQFTSMLKILKNWTSKRGYSTFYLDGETNNRGALIDSFEKSSQGIFFISLKAGGTGINLISANQIIIYDPWWNPAVENQAMDRLHRIGQLKTVYVYRLIANDTIEEKILKLQDEKQQIFTSIMKNQDNVFSIKEIKKLLN